MKLRLPASLLVSRSLYRISGFLAVVALVAAFTARPASAQTPVAQFSYAMRTLGSGVGGFSGVAVDANGNVFVADNASTTVTEIPASCIAGANNASCVVTLGGGFLEPYGVAVDGSGNVFVADNGNNAVKEIPASCIAGANNASCVVTLGGGFNGPQSVTVDASGDVFVADTSNQAVTEIPASCIAGANNASCVKTLGGGFILPKGVAVDGSGNVFVADSDSTTIMEIPSGCTASGCVRALGGGFFLPTGVAVDGSGDVFVADNGNQAVKEIPASCIAGANNASCVKTLGGGLNPTFGVAVDGNGKVFFSSNDNNAVEELELHSADFGTEPIGTTSAAETLTFTFNASVTLGAPVVLTMGAKGFDFNIANGGSCTSGASFAAGDTCTVKATFTPGVAGERKGAVNLTNSTGAVIATAYVYGTGLGPQAVFDSTPATADAAITIGGGFTGPDGVAVDGSGNVYVTNFSSSGNSTVNEIPAGCSTTACVKAIGGGFGGPEGVAVDGAGNVYVTGSSSSGAVTVDKIPSGCTTASCVSTIGGGFTGPIGVAVDGSGNVYVADDSSPFAGTVDKIPSGCTTAACVKAIGGGFGGLAGVAVDGGGNVYVADDSYSAVKEIPASCIAGANNASCVKTIGGGFTYPYGVAVDGSGNVYVADEDGFGIQEIPAGCTTTACVKTIGAFTDPSDVAVDGFGNLFYIAYPNGAAVVDAIVRAIPPALSFSSTNVGATSSPLAVTVTNVGNMPLTFPIPTAAGTYNPSVAANFTYDNSSTCLQNGASAATAFTLAAGASCTAAIDFAPTTTGDFTGNAVLTDNSLGITAPNNTQKIALSGTGALPVTQLAFSTSPASTLTAGGNAGTVTVDEQDSIGATVTTATDTITLTVAGPNGYSETYTATASAGVATFNLSSSALDTAGSYTYTATSGSISKATTTGTVTAAAASAITAVSGGRQSAAINTAFASALTVKVEDSFGNPVSGATVVFTAPTSGASATLSAPAVTDSNGETSVTATANGTVSATAYSVTASVSGVSGTASFPLTNTEATATVTLGDLAQTYTGSPLTATATTNPAGLAVSFTYNGSATAPTQAGSYTVVATINDPSHTGTATGTLVIAKAATTTTLSAGASSIAPGQNLVLTANVASAATGAPIGTVAFFDGTTQLGTATLANGTASFTASSLTSGTHSFTASYSGGTNFQPSTSSTPVSIPVENLTFSLNLTGGQGQTVVPGSPAGYTLEITPTYGTYPGVVSFTATGLPTGATATFSPATIAANGGAQTVTMTIQTPPATAAQNHKSSPLRRGGEVALGFLLVPFLGLRKRKRWMRLLSVVLLIVGMGAFTGLVSGCGTSGFFGQQQKTYSVTVTATSGTVSQSSVVTLNVE